MFRFGAWNTVVLSSYQQGWVRSVGMSLLLSWLQHWVSQERASFWCVVHFLSVWYTCITSISVGFPSDVSLVLTHLLDGKLSYPHFTSRNMRPVTAHAFNFWQHPGIHWCIRDLAGFSVSALTCQKHPQGCKGNLGRSRDVVDRSSQPMTHLSNSFPWKTLKINLAGMTNSF